MTNISTFFKAPMCSLETSFRPAYGFVMFTNFSCFSAHNQKRKKQTHQNWFLINYGRLIN